MQLHLKKRYKITKYIINLFDVCHSYMKKKMQFIYVNE